MESYLTPQHYDLVTPDGSIREIAAIDEKHKMATVAIEEISPAFRGFEIDLNLVFFNLKSTLAQLGMNGVSREIFLDKKQNSALVKVELTAIGPLAAAMLDLLQPGAYIGKLFAADERRRVRDPDYLMRMFGRSDRRGRPLLSLGGFDGSRDLILEKNAGRTVAFLTLKDGVVSYDDSVYGFLPTLAMALKKNMPYTRQLLHLHHRTLSEEPRIVKENEILLVR